MRMRLLEEWNKFASSVLSPDCPQLYRAMARRTFYAGTASIIDALSNALSHKDEVTPEDIEVMTDFGKELLMFAEDMRQGRA